VLSAVAFLEGYVNETLEDLVDKDVAPSSPRTAGIPETTVTTVRRLWKGADSVERGLKTLQKYQIILACAHKELLDNSSEPFQSVDVIIRLRNALVHFRPEWQWVGEDNHEKKFLETLKQKLRGRENQQAIGDPWYPNKALGAGCADWACDSSFDLVKEFHGCLGLTSDFGTEFGPDPRVATT